jgi:predicted aconitase
MFLSNEDERVLRGDYGHAAKKSMEILVALGDLFEADKLIPIKSVQVAGVSYHNLGDAGLEFLAELAKDGRVLVPTFLNPAGMDLVDWKKLKIPEDFAKKQQLVIDAFAKMGINTTCTCTPYLIGIEPKFGEHVAWAESSAVTYCNSVIGARTNREGGPSALAAAFVGKTPNYGLHLDENRKPTIAVKVSAELNSMADWGALGWVIGKKAPNSIPLIEGVKKTSVDNLKTFCASVVTYGAQPLFYIKGLTPEADKQHEPAEKLAVGEAELKEAYDFINDKDNTIDFVSLGCPHASIDEIKEVARLLKGKKLAAGVEMWISCARPIKERAESLGFAKIIEDSGAVLAADTCMAVAPLKGRFKSVATTSAKGCFYCSGHNMMKTHIGSLEQCVKAALEGKWS